MTFGCAAGSPLTETDQGKRLLARKRLDPPRAGDAQQRAVEAVELDEGRATSPGLGGEVDHVGPLAHEKQHRQPVFAANEGQLASFCQRLHERLGPKVLVYVDLDHHRLVSYQETAVKRLTVGAVPIWASSGVACSTCVIRVIVALQPGRTGCLTAADLDGSC